jgi:arsenate reductase
MTASALTLYHYPGCSTCKKAIRWLTTHAIAFTPVDLVATPPEATVLRQILKQTGSPVQKLFNTSGQMYREGNYKTALHTLSESEALSALSTHGKLIRRPLLVGKSVCLIGFQEAAYQAAFPFP